MFYILNIKYQINIKYHTNLSLVKINYLLQREQFLIAGEPN